MEHSSALQPLCSPRDAMSSIDNAILKLEDNLRELKKHRNLLSHFLRLPMEILRMIIVLVTKAEPLLSPPMMENQWRNRDRGQTWLRLCHICSRLREIVEGIPRIWADNAFAYAKGRLERIALSGSLPLTIRLRAQDQEDTTGLDRSTILSARKIDIYVSYLGTVWTFDHRRIHEQTFPHLEMLHVVSQAFPKNPDAENVYEASPMQAPRLRDVSLRDGYIPVPLSQLESFELRLRAGADPAMIPNASRLANMLRSMTVLEHLTLIGCLPSLNVPAVLDRVRLPRLRRLLLGRDPDTLLSWIPLIEIPQKAQLVLDTIIYDEGHARQTRLLQTIAPMLLSRLRAESETIARLNLSEIMDDFHTLTIELRVTAKGTPLLVDRPWLSIIMKGWLDDETPPFGPALVDIVANVHNDYRLQDLAVMEVATDAHCNTPANWELALQLYENVSTIILPIIPPPYGLWNAVCSKPTRSGDQGILLPRLKTLALGPLPDLLFLGKGWGRFTPNGWNEQTLLSGLRYRHRTGAPVTALTLARSPLVGSEAIRGVMDEFRRELPGLEVELRM